MRRKRKPNDTRQSVGPRARLLFLSLVLAPSVALAILPNNPCIDEYIWLEAECGDIHHPGQTGSDSAASEGGYLTTPPHSGRYIGQQAGDLIASYRYELTADCHDTYYLWARVKYDSSAHNSFWVAFDHSADFPWRFNDHQTGHWHWERLGEITGLNRGWHQLYIKLREEQTWVDKFFMTSDQHYTPSGYGQVAANRCSNQPPAGVAIPQDPDRFLTFFNAVSPSHEESEQTAQAYYRAIDPLDQKRTFAAWASANGIQSGADAQAIYVNDADLGFGRRMFIKSLNGGNVASYVENYMDNTPSPDPVDGPPEEKIRNAHFGNNFFATVAMEYSASPLNPFGRKYTKFYAFDANGNRVTKVDLDGRGEKFIPGACNVCHGGNPRPLLSNGTYPERGETGAGFLPWDLDTFEFSQTMPQYSRAAQEAEFKELNRAVLGTNPPPATRELINGWYGGPGLPNFAFNGNFVPIGWNGHEAAYLDVLAQNCRACHIMRNPALDFSTFQKFDTLGNRAQHLVLDQGVMPLAKRTYQRFWTGFSPANPGVIDLFGNVPASRRPDNGPPIAYAGVDRSVRVGDSIRLDATGSLFANSFFWMRIRGPLGSFANVNQPTLATPTFTPDRVGQYTFEVEAANARGFDTARVIVTATNGGPAGVDFASEIVPILTLRCLSCHTTNGSAPAFDGPILSNRNEAIYRNFSRVVNAFEPAQSLAILKATGAVAHVGGTPLAGQQGELATLLAWIQEGVNREPIVGGPSVQTRILTVSTGNGGTVSNPGIGTFGFDQGMTVSVSAAANSSWIFDRWTGSAVANGKVANPNSANTTVRMDGDYTLRANFRQQGGAAWVEVVSLGLTYDVPQHRNPNLSLDFSFNRVVKLNFRADLKVEIQPASPAGGVWSATVTPSTINPGEVTITVHVKGDHIDITALTPAARDVRLANVKLLARPAP